MFACTHCSTIMPATDRHDACVVHRKCSRAKPCEFDKFETAEYWDDVEAMVKALKYNPRKSSRSASASAVKPKARVKKSNLKGKKGGGAIIVTSPLSLTLL